MKCFLLSIALIVTFPFFAQKSEEKQRSKHSFYLAAGIFGQTNIFDLSQPSYDYSGITSSLVYQISFPKRFVLGAELLSDQSFFKKEHSWDPNVSNIGRLSGISLGVQLGVNVLRKKHFDLSVLIVPHVNLQKYIVKKHTLHNNETELLKYKSRYLFVPFAAWRFDFYYKFNQLHSIGLATDFNFDIELYDLFGNVLLGVARAMFSYRFTLPSS